MFLRKVTARAIPVYAALTYDGRTDLSPADPFDAAILSAVQRASTHRQGFWAGARSGRGKAAISGFEASGYTVVHGKSDWVIGPDDRAMQIELLQGWANAARDMTTLDDAEIARLARAGAATVVSDGLSSMRVGHVDLLALPSATR